MKKIGKIILIIILILVIAYLSVSIYKFCTINKLVKMDNENKNRSNFYLSYKFDEDKESSTKVYYKDGNFKTVYNSSNDEEKVFYGEKDKNTTYTLNENNEIVENTTTKVVNTYKTFSSEFEVYDLNTLKGKIMFSISPKTWVSSNENSYKLTYSNTLEIQLSKDNYTLTKVKTSTDTRTFEVKFDTVKDSDVILEK